RKVTRLEGMGSQTESGAGNDSESADCDGDELRQIVIRDIFDDFGAARGERAVRKRYGHSNDQVTQGAKAQTKRAAVVGGQNAADGGFFGPQWINSQALAVLRERLLQSLNRAAGFHGDCEVGPGVLEDAVQTRGRQDKVGACGRIAPP